MIPKTCNGLELTMLAAIERLMRLHPAYSLGHRENHRSELEAFNDLESGHLRLRPWHECEVDRSEPNLMARVVINVTIMLVVFCGAFAIIASLTGDVSDRGRQPVVAATDAAELR
jgi:hypothetical protein